MRKFKGPSTRLAASLVLLTVNLLFLANLLGFVPDTMESILDLRKGLTESMALQFSTAAEKSEYQVIQATLREVVDRNEEIRSAAIRTKEGQLIALAGEHLAYWKEPADGKSTPTHIQVPVFRKGEKWASVQVRFAPLPTSNLLKTFSHSFAGLIAFISLSGFISYFIVIKRTLRELDPTTVIPERVQKAFDVLREGVFIVDEKEHIVMANKSFAKIFAKTPETIIGVKGSELGWVGYKNPRRFKQLPWIMVLNEGVEQNSSSLSLIDLFGKKTKFSVSAAAILDKNGKCRGSLVTFDDITQLEEKNFELGVLVEKLRLSNDEINTKSQELEFLANHDPLTHCLNRRAMDRKLHAVFSNLKSQGGELSCIMVDIDHFKLVNDRYGHGAGDQVIKSVANILKSAIRDKDMVGRYGGEEFCVILPELSQQQAFQIAERIRQVIQESDCAGINVTVSLGVSSLANQANKPDELVNQADKALYTAKQTGRNRVINWGKESKTSTETNEKHQNSKEDPASPKYKNENNILQKRVYELEGQIQKLTLEQKHYEMYDFKTGLPKQLLFQDRIKRETARAKRKGHLVCVVAIAIDIIKKLSQTVGQDVADSLTKACGERLNDILRSNIDTVAIIDDLEKKSTVSYINENHFGLLLTEINEVDCVTWVIKRIIDAFEKPFLINNNEFFTSPFIGISIYPHDGENAEKLFSSAIHAANHAKKSNGKNRYQFALHNLNQMAVRQLQIEISLHSAIKNKELEIHYQPQFHAKTGEIHGAEALLRWNSNQLGLISPNDFIPVAEHTGLIDSIGEWVLHTGCSQMKHWIEMGIDIKRIAINFSGIQLRQKDLAIRVKEILEELQLSPKQLEIELTESSLADAYDKSFSILKQMKDYGIRITVDDFGTGYSSLRYLCDIPLSCIKIDRSFTERIGKDKGSEKLIQSIISMAHGLGIEAVAEGIEESHQVEFLNAAGCDFLQGYFFCKPLPSTDAENFILNRLNM